MSKYIEVKNVTVSYGDFVALKNINFGCEKGEFIAIVGGSGTGKSSFLNAIAGFIEYSGEIKTPENIGYIFQNYTLYPWLNVEQNIMFGLQGMTKKEKLHRVEDLLAKIELKEFRTRYPAQLSGGQVQRVALARTFAPNPDVILMDEPYGSLDHHTRDRMQEWLLHILREARSQGLQKTILFVTHYLEESIFLADRIVVINHNKFVKEFEVPFTRPRDKQMRFSQEFLNLKSDILKHMEN